MFDSGVILKEEVRCWSLSGIKGLMHHSETITSYIFYFSALAVSKPNDQMYPYDFRDAVKKKVTINTCNRFDCKTVDVGDIFCRGMV